MTAAATDTQTQTAVAVAAAADDSQLMIAKLTERNKTQGHLLRSWKQRLREQVTDNQLLAVAVCVVIGQLTAQFGMLNDSSASFSYF